MPEPVHRYDCAKTFESAEVESSVRHEVVRVFAKSGGDIVGTGTGFILAPEPTSEAMLIATNYHVVHPGEDFDIQIESAGGQPLHISSVEVVKVDRASDLALLLVPSRMSSQGLSINPSRPVVGRRWAALGFPGGALDAPMTFESGEITATKRSIGGSDFVQTNINLNPGNSGGPVVDACGTVAGIATALVEGANGMALVVPSERLAVLYDDYRKKRPPAESEVKERLGSFMQAMEYRRTDKAVNYLSRTYLLNVGGPILRDYLTAAAAKLQLLEQTLRLEGYEWASLTAEQQVALMERLLHPNELVSVALYWRMKTNEVDSYEALRLFTPIFIHEQFGEIRTHRIQDVEMRDAKHAEAMLEVHAGEGMNRYVLHLVQEWGDWSIEQIEPISGPRMATVQEPEPTYYEPSPSYDEPQQRSDNSDGWPPGGVRTVRSPGVSSKQGQ